LSFANDPLPSVSNLDSSHSKDCNPDVENENVAVFDCYDILEQTETEKGGKENTNQLNVFKHET